jgi:hypothetical protein
MPIDDKTLRHYFYAIIALAVACLLAYVLLSFARDDVGSQEQLYQGVPLNEHLLQVDKEALELAYKDQLKLLFSVWLKDDITTVHRINNGLRNARSAYAHAVEQLERRERQLKEKAK